MENKAIISKFVEGRPVTFGNSATEKTWKDTIKNSLKVWTSQPLEKSHVCLDFSLKPERFMRQGKQPRNDLDNLSKPVLDALVELGVFDDDSGILDLTLRKRKSDIEGVMIEVYPFLQNDSVFNQNASHKIKKLVDDMCKDLDKQINERVSPEVQTDVVLGLTLPLQQQIEPIADAVNNQIYEQIRTKNVQKEKINEIIESVMKQYRSKIDQLINEISTSVIVQLKEKQS